MSCGSISVKTNRHFEKKSKKKIYDVTKKNFFFSFSLFLVLKTLFARFENFSPIWLCWIFTFFVPRNNSESWRPKTKSCIPGWPDGQPDDERANFDLLAAKMAEIWSSDEYRVVPVPKVKWENWKVRKKVFFFSKMKVMAWFGAKNISTVGPSRACASFVYTSQRVTPLFLMAKCKKPEFRSLLADLRHFLTSDVILKENFCR